MRGLAAREAALRAAGKTGEAAPELGIMCRGDLRGPRTREWRWPSTGGQKTGLRNLRAGPARVVRPQAERRSRPRLRRPADLPRGRGPARGLPALWSR